LARVRDKWRGLASLGDAGLMVCTGGMGGIGRLSDGMGKIGQEA
jgi:biotin synthase-like enzyme